MIHGMTQPSPGEPTPTAFNIDLPPEHVEGHYADFASIWHNNETFILDFVAMSTPPMPGQDEQGNPVAVVNTRVVTRVRIPASQVWEVMKGLEAQLSAYEAENPHRKPTQPGI